MIILAQIVIKAADLLFLLLCVRALCTWFVQFGWPWVDTVYRISFKCTEFLVSPCRKVTDKINTGMFDMSLVLACLVIILARDILVRLIMIF